METHRSWVARLPDLEVDGLGAAGDGVGHADEGIEGGDVPVGAEGDLDPGFLEPTDGHGVGGEVAADVRLQLFLAG